MKYKCKDCKHIDKQIGYAYDRCKLTKENTLPLKNACNKVEPVINSKNIIVFSGECESDYINEIEIIGDMNEDGSIDICIDLLEGGNHSVIYLNKEKAKKMANSILSFIEDNRRG